MEGLEARIRRLEDREAIRELVIRYGFVVDDRDLDGIRALFTDDAVLRTAAGRIKGEGIDGVVGYFENHLPSLGPTNHVTHGGVIEFDPDDADLATGTVAAHAEVWRNDKPMVTAMRYLDVYQRVGDTWRFKARTQTYMYFVDVREYPEALGARLRVRANPDDPQPADWPRMFT